MLMSDFALPKLLTPWTATSTIGFIYYEGAMKGVGKLKEVFTGFKKGLLEKSLFGSRGLNDAAGGSYGYEVGYSVGFSTSGLTTSSFF